SGVITNYVYNLENRLSEIRDGNNNLIASYRYDPFGKRISKTVGGNTTYYYYSEDGLVAEADNNGAVTTSYHYQLNTPWGTDPMFIRQGGVYGYYVTDHLGTPQRVVGRNGAVLWGAVYDAYGEAGIVTASLVNNLRFPGQYFDSESGLHYNYFRYYDPTTGRYITSDPIGLAGGLNTYGYVGGNPVGAIDPLGLYQMCHRDLLLPIPYARHCYMGYGDGSTSSYDPSGVNPDPDQNQEGTMCTEPKEPEKDDCIKKAMEKCDGSNYDFTGFNCCHCAEQAMKECGASISPDSWPNWPINPGPQPGEPGYSPFPAYGPALGQ
ncbi:MAG: hypothetical protein GY820_08210, partial [Gammaproteobacteria bacterium]|nr:hypothetical protein [Gammaproteobacteria bacterium]